MKIALLNLQYDNNYGGNLQRYALMKVLQDMGHDVTHLNLRFNFNPQPWYIKLKRIPRRILYKLFRNRHIDIFPEYNRQKLYEQQCSTTDIFYNRYIKHTPIIDSKKKLQSFLGYDLYFVGSDQVWRKTIAAIYGISTFFFDYLPKDITSPRIAYGVSLGTDENELNKQDLNDLTPLYHKFEAVSVREESALKLLESYKWNSPKPIQVLDPTLLLDKTDYNILITNGETHPLAGNLFCYILDMTDEKQKIIDKISKQKDLKPFFINIKQPQPPIEQWLRSFRDSEYIITDSYHGLVFATIYNKPFILIQNAFRGNARFDSLFKTLYIGTSIENPIWDCVNQNINYWRDISINFLNNSLKS